jgi:comEA protein
MISFTHQEKLLFRLLISGAIIGVIIGAVRNYTLNKDVVTVNEILVIPNDSSLKNIIQVDSAKFVVSKPVEISQENIEHLSTNIVNINLADKIQLMSLPFIGGVKAERIIQYREDFGKFESIEELMKVSGIGPKTLEKLKPFVII